MASRHLQHALRVTLLNAVPAAYGPVLALQELLWRQRKEGAIADTLLQLQVWGRRGWGRQRVVRWGPSGRCLLPTRLCHPAADPAFLAPMPLQHSPVYTIGKRGGEADFVTGPHALRAAGAEVFVVPRGGETTYHGPGQLVVYPIVSLRELGVGARAYVEGLEDALVQAVGAYGISARVSGYVCNMAQRSGGQGLPQQEDLVGCHSCYGAAQCSAELLSRLWKRVQGQAEGTKPSAGDSGARSLTAPHLRPLMCPRLVGPRARQDGRVGRRAQDRGGGRAHLPWRHLARHSAQRVHRPGCLSAHRPLRHARQGGDVNTAGAGAGGGAGAGSRGVLERLHVAVWVRHTGAAAGRQCLRGAGWAARPSALALNRCEALSAARPFSPGIFCLLHLLACACLQCFAYSQHSPSVCPSRKVTLR